MPARLLHITLLVTALIITPSLAQSLVTKINQQVPSNAAAMEPQGHLLVQVDETNFPFPPFPQDDKDALRAVLVATPELLKIKDPDKATATANKKLDGLKPHYGPVFVARFESSLGPENMPLAKSPQFVQFAASQTKVDGQVLVTWELSAKGSDFYGNDNHPIGVPWTDRDGRWWWVDQRPEKQTELPNEPTYQDFKEPALQALTDRSCAMSDIPGSVEPWKEGYDPGDRIEMTRYYQTWLVSPGGGILHRPMGYIDWKFDLIGTVGKDQRSTSLTIQNSSYNWRDSPGQGNDVYANLVGVNYPNF